MQKIRVCIHRKTKKVRISEFINDYAFLFSLARAQFN